MICEKFVRRVRRWCGTSHQRHCIVVFMIASLAAALCSCGDDSNPIDPGPNTAIVSFAMSLGPAYDAGFAVDRVTVTIRGASYADSMDLAVAADSAFGQFGAVPVGSYVIAAYLYEETTLVATGSGAAEVRAGQTTPAAITIGLVGSVRVEVTWGENAWRSVLDLDGSSTSVTVPHSAALNVGGPFTLEAWVIARDYQYPGHQVDVFPNNVIIDKRDDVGFGRGYGLSVNAGYPTVAVAVSENLDVWATSATPIELNRLHHIAGTWDGDSLRVFLDGSCTGRVSVPETHVVGLGELVMGARYSHNQYWWDGQFAGVRISDACRYVGDFEPPPTLLPDGHTLASWPFDTGSGAAALDVSGHAHHGAIQNGAWAPLVRGPLRPTTP